MSRNQRAALDRARQALRDLRKACSDAGRAIPDEMGRILLEASDDAARSLEKLDELEDEQWADGGMLAPRMPTLPGLLENHP